MNLISDEGILAQLLAAAGMRSRVIANNLANQNTPGFKRKVVQFEDLVLAELKRGSSNIGSIQPKIVVDSLTPSGPDGNNVNLELEINSMNENRILYETYSAIMSSHMELIRASIEDGR